MGYEIENGVKGTFRLTQVTQQAEQVFSKRDQQIDTLVQERGIRNYAGTRGIVLATRANKINSNLSEREETWEREAKENRIQLIAEKQNPLLMAPIKSDDQIFTQVSQKLTAQQSTFKENLLLRETALASFGVRNATEVQELIKEAQGKGYIVGLDNGLLTTPDMAKIEQGIIAHVDGMVVKEHYGVNANKAIENGIPTSDGKKLDFSEEQKLAIKTATGNSAIAVIQGRAGVGKSTMLAAVRESYEQQGWKVQGIALAGVAAQNLQKESGIESKTIASWLPKDELDAKTVVIIDEAGMVGSKQMSDIIQKVEMAQAKLVLVGDERQLQPMGKTTN